MLIKSLLPQSSLLLKGAEVPRRVRGSPGHQGHQGHRPSGAPASCTPPSSSVKGGRVGPKELWRPEQTIPRKRRAQGALEGVGCPRPPWGIWEHPCDGPAFCPHSAAGWWPPQCPPAPPVYWAPTPSHLLSRDGARTRRPRGGHASETLVFASLKAPSSQDSGQGWGCPSHWAGGALGAGKQAPCAAGAGLRGSARPGSQRPAAVPARGG